MEEFSRFSFNNCIPSISALANSGSSSSEKSLLNSINSSKVNLSGANSLKYFSLWSNVSMKVEFCLRSTIQPGVFNTSDI